MTDDELRSLFESLRQENAAAHEETRRHFNETADRNSAENRHHFDVASEDTRHQIQLVAESVVATRDEIHRELTDVREEMRRGFVETQAMMKFSHAELDRRVMALEENRRSVEETLANLQARVERLESSTH